MEAGEGCSPLHTFCGYISVLCFARQKTKLSKQETAKLIEKLTKEMKEAAKLLEFEHAAFLRDKIAELKGEKK